MYCSNSLGTVSICFYFICVSSLFWKNSAILLMFSFSCNLWLQQKTSNLKQNQLSTKHFFSVLAFSHLFSSWMTRTIITQLNSLKMFKPKNKPKKKKWWWAMNDDVQNTLTIHLWLETYVLLWIHLLIKWHQNSLL